MRRSRRRGSDNNTSSVVKIADIEIIIKLFTAGQSRLITFRHREATHRMRTGLSVGARRVWTTAFELFHLEGEEVATDGLSYQ